MIKKLTDEQFRSTMISKMVNVTPTAETVLDIWPYVEMLVRKGVVHPVVLQKELVEHVYRSRDEKFDHVLLPTANEERFIVMIVDVNNELILGYYDLDLKEEYS